MSKTTKQVTLAEATNKQLRDFCSGHLGLMLGNHPLTNKALHAKIREAAWDKPFIVVPVDESVEVEPKAAQAPVPTKLGTEPLVTIEIPVGEDEDGKDYVFVGVNGRGIYLTRGEPIQIKYRYYLALKHAQKLVTDQRGDGIHTEDHRRIVPQYPFSVVEMPPAAVIEAWLAEDAKPARKKAA